MRDLNPGRTNALQPPIATETFQVNKDITYNLRKLSISTMFKNTRYLLTKRFVRRESLSSKEELALFLLVDHLSGVRDRGFIESNCRTFSAMLSLNKLTNLAHPEKDNMRNAVKLLQKNSKLFLSPRAYLGFDFCVNNVIKRVNRRLRAKPKPDRFIGVGYKDTGHQGNSAIDGNPSWQAVVAATKLSVSPTRFFTCKEIERENEQSSSTSTVLVLPEPADYLGKL